jgi:hypothetical protein
VWLLIGEMGSHSTKPVTITNWSHAKFLHGKVDIVLVWCGTLAKLARIDVLQLRSRNWLYWGGRRHAGSIRICLLCNVLTTLTSCSVPHGETNEHDNWNCHKRNVCIRSCLFGRLDAGTRRPSIGNTKSTVIATFGSARTRIRIRRVDERETEFGDRIAVLVAVDGSAQRVPLRSKRSGAAQAQAQANRAKRTRSSVSRDADGSSGGAGEQPDGRECEWGILGEDGWSAATDTPTTAADATN